MIEKTSDTKPNDDMSNLAYGKVVDDAHKLWGKLLETLSCPWKPYDHDFDVSIIQFPKQDYFVCDKI